MRKILRTSLILVLALMAGAAAGADPSCSASRDAADNVLRAPRILQPVQAFSTVLAPDAVVASEVQVVDTDLFRIDRAISISTPIAVHVDAGQTFGRRMIDGVLRMCIYRGVGVIYSPPVDEEGRPFPTICLEDRNGDGRYETARLFAYHAAPGHGILEARIDPVRLEALRDLPTPDFGRFFVYRRLRVLSVTGDRARFISDFAMNGAAMASNIVDYEPVTGTEVEVALHEGDVEVDGLTLHLLHVGEGWPATPEGRFSTWVGLRCDDTRIWMLNAPRAASNTMQ